MTISARASKLKHYAGKLQGDPQFADGSVWCGNCWPEHNFTLGQRFREGRLSIENDPKSGRPRTATDDQSVERVLQILEEDRRVPSGTTVTAAYYCQFLQKTEA